MEKSLARGRARHRINGGGAGQQFESDLLLVLQLRLRIGDFCDQRRRFFGCHAA
ncbi:hypothetical protein [Sphingopyxis sp.]|uniref:hypothetical protein n=1 Tax=Sphingopyxis sp. TaxID=1908224 RepID=UPI001E106165|nr:hypothetical protein [Sphingopyxis sp.]MBW8296095.1 hypothetical protein [Sphingopyxis sp.]